VDRFFSKLDLRDIKIDPFKTSFPPDGEEAVDDGAPVVAETARQPHVPAWAAAAERAEAALLAEPAAPVANGEDVAPFIADTAPAPFIAEMSAPFAAASAPVAAPFEVVDGLDPSSGVLKVSARSRPSAVAGAIAGVVREHGRAEVQAIGAGATNQAVKAVAIAREYLRETGIEAVCLPAFIDVTIENEDRTAIRLVVEPR
jgi:stage V sporulation protein S